MNRVKLFHKFLLWKTLHPEKLVCDYCRADKTNNCFNTKGQRIFRHFSYVTENKKWRHNYSLTNRLSEFKHTTVIESFCLKFLLPDYYKVPKGAK